MGNEYKFDTKEEFLEKLEELVKSGVKPNTVTRAATRINVMNSVIFFFVLILCLLLVKIVFLFSNVFLNLMGTGDVDFPFSL